jgi:hypothetical protein
MANNLTIKTVALPKGRGIERHTSAVEFLRDFAPLIPLPLGERVDAQRPGEGELNYKCRHSTMHRVTFTGDGNRQRFGAVFTWAHADTIPKCAVKRRKRGKAQIERQTGYLLAGQIAIA